MNDVSTKPADSVSLSFLDLLYAVPVADVAMRVSGTELKDMPPQGWGDIGLVLVAIVLGWIGHHRNRELAPRKRAGEFEFGTLRFLQFIFEVLVILVYFALAVRIELPSHGGTPDPSASWQTLWLVILFGLYLGWDTLDISIATGNSKWQTRARKGRNVTASFLVVF